MGALLGTHAKSTVDTLNDIGIHIILDNFQHCMSNTDQEIIRQFKDIKGNVVIEGNVDEQFTSVDIKCVMSVATQNAIKDNIAEAFAQQVEAKGQAILSMFGHDVGEAKTTIKNKFDNTLTNKTCEEVKTMIRQINKSSFDHVDKDVLIIKGSTKQSSHVIATTLMKSKEYNNVSSFVATKIDQGVLAESKNPLASVIQSFGTALGRIFSVPMVILIIIVLLGVGAGVLYKFFLQNHIEF